MIRVEETVETAPQCKPRLGVSEWLPLAILMFFAVCEWLVPITTPLWLDETSSYWQISGGFSGIWSRSLVWPCSVVYSYILWVTKTLLGSNEVVLRIPSAVAMIAAAYFLYRAAEKLFGREVALVAVGLFSVNPAVVFAAIDVRTYAFALLMVNGAGYALVSWIKDGETKYAVAFGLACSGILYFHYLFVVIFPAFAIYLLVEKQGNLRQPAIALSSFLVASIPLIPLLLPAIHSRNQHSFAPSPSLLTALSKLVPGSLSVILIFSAVAIAGATKHVRAVRQRGEYQSIALPMAVAIVPTSILYLASVLTPMQVFLDRYLLPAAPGIALCWAWPLTFINWRKLSYVVGAGILILNLKTVLHNRTEHAYTWKYALDAAEPLAARDGATVFVCSDFVESNTQPELMTPVESSPVFSQLSYYKLQAPVVGLPRAFDKDTVDRVDKYLEQSGGKRSFLVMAYAPSYPTLRWIGDRVQRSYKSISIGKFDGVEVVEFVPR